MVSLVGCGLIVYKILRCFSDRTYLLFLPLLSVLYLIKMSIHGEYLVDGAVGVALMPLVLSVLLKVRKTGSVAGHEVASTPLLRGQAGLLSVCYAFLYALLALPHYKASRQRLAAPACLVPTLFIYLFNGWLGVPVSLPDG